MLDKLTEGHTWLKSQWWLGLVAWIFLAGIIGYALYIDDKHSSQSRDAIVTSGRAVSVSGCNRDYDTIDALRDQLENSLERIDLLVQDGTYTPRQAEIARKSTKDVLANYTLPDCRVAATVVTSDPNKDTYVPDPRYPNDPKQLSDEGQEAKTREERLEEFQRETGRSQRQGNRENTKANESNPKRSTP